MNKQQARTRDHLLKAIREEGKHFRFEDYCKEHKLHVDVHTSVLEQLQDLGLVGLIEISRTKETDPLRCYLIHILPRGLYFLDVEGGFMGQHRKATRSTIWITAKTIAAILNAVMIILIGYWSLNEQRKSNADRETLQEVKYRVEVLERKLSKPQK